MVHGALNVQIVRFHDHSDHIVRFIASIPFDIAPVPTCEGSIQLSFQYLGGY
ncbi:hypothetical protein SISSUDRAFT_1102013 [Sistotremastrum suecicum HHB10207 ss-3]|uniref:Uncharacterized protein n=1 Tax=Sistotremastrum suecicum HHB10207 ss-3 TaxID=1314776 RepID=A0A165WQJ0_9AGAM|nr:hypothetical protein SISSUDRAFT_1102013 [Sistotremastrum suecicum HHB10207 ss-3]